MKISMTKSCDCFEKDSSKDRGVALQIGQHSRQLQKSEDSDLGREAEALERNREPTPIYLHARKWSIRWRRQYRRAMKGWTHGLSHEEVSLDFYAHRTKINSGRIKDLSMKKLRRKTTGMCRRIIFTTWSENAFCESAKTFRLPRLPCASSPHWESCFPKEYLQQLRSPPASQPRCST